GGRQREPPPARRGQRPQHARTLRVRERGDLPPDPGFAPGPHREGEEPKPMMHGREKSDPAIVAVKPRNKAGQPDAGCRTGKACPRRWTEYGKPQGRERRNGSPRSSTTSASICFEWRFSILS